MNMNTETTFDSILTSFRKTVLEKIPYRINLVDILGANENKHTTILAEILRYERMGEYPFLKSFLDCVINGDTLPVVENPQIETQREYIDALIYEKGKYAIVVENKIDWATDQPKQIERYINAAKEICRIDAPEHTQNLWVIYLTDDGQKKVSPDSLTDKAKQLLGVADVLSYPNHKNKSRYIESNYRDDILPWIKEYVLPECRYSENELIAMLQQYIGYLEKRFNVDKTRSDSLSDCFFSKLLGKEGGDIKRQYDFLKELLRWCQSAIDQTRNLLASAVQNQLFKLLDSNYRVDENDAIEAKMNAVSEWLTQHGLVGHLHRLRRYQCVYFEYQVVGQRIKLQFDIGKTEVLMQFFNNDYERPAHKTIADFPQIDHLISSTLQFEKTEEWCATTKLGTANCKQELFDLLDRPDVINFIKTYHNCLNEWVGVSDNDSKSNRQ